MEMIRLKFKTGVVYDSRFNVTVILTLDENGKSIKPGRGFPSIDAMNDHKALLERVMATFTEKAIDEILSNKEIPDDNDVVIDDDVFYDITISKGNIRRIYHAHSGNIGTYTLLKLLSKLCDRL